MRIVTEGPRWIATQHRARTQGKVAETQYFGAFWRLHVAVAAGARLLADVPAAAGVPTVGQDAFLHWDDGAVHALGAAA